jgi:hypothetical protein
MPSRLNPRRGPRVLVLGIMGSQPFGGVAWQGLHYLEGLQRRGCDVHYLEDVGYWPGHQVQRSPEEGIANTLRHLERVMAWVGMPHRWAFRSPLDHALHGLDEGTLREVVARTDVLLNVTASRALDEGMMRIPVRIYLETDPVTPQLEIASGWQKTIELLAAHTHHFTYGENLGTPRSGVPVAHFSYRATRPPVVLDWWQGSALDESHRPGGRYTTIASWSQPSKDFEWAGRVYGWSKSDEFVKFLDLPSLRPVAFELALAKVDEAARRLLESHGWRVVAALPLSSDIFSYRQYISGSRAEFTVAKDQNVRLRSGWFSDRSATYLAAGRPVITQETGFSDNLPTGTGLFAFTTLDDILSAVDTIEADYRGHCRAAREMADGYFSAERVIGRMLEEAGC